MPADLKKCARYLDSARLEKREVLRLTVETPGLSLSEAYQIQAEGLAMRFARGEKAIGYKMGLTSKAKMKQMNVDAPIYGVLTDAMLLKNGGKYDLSKSIHAKIEPEVAFRMGAGGKPDAVCAAMEIIDSRYENFNFTLPDVIADNTSAHAFVLGEWRPLTPALDLSNLGMILEINGQGAQFGSTAAILGHPLESLKAQVALLSTQGKQLKPGEIVLAGSSTAAVTMEKGMRVRARVEELSEVSIEVI